MTFLYLAVLVAVVYFTRATTRRVLGALAGGAVVGLMATPAEFGTDHPEPSKDYKSQ